MTENRHKEMWAFMLKSFDFRDQTLILRVITCRHRLALYWSAAPGIFWLHWKLFIWFLFMFPKRIYTYISFWMSPFWAYEKSNSNINQMTSLLTWYWMRIGMGNSSSCLVVLDCPRGLTGRIPQSVHKQREASVLLNAVLGSWLALCSQRCPELQSELSRDKSCDQCIGNCSN